MQLQRRCQHQRWFVLFAGDACDDGDDNTIEDVVNSAASVSEYRPSLDARTMTRAYNPEANVDDDSCYYLGVGSIVGPLFPDAGDTATHDLRSAWHLVRVVRGRRWLLEGQGTEEVVVVWGQESGRIH